MAAYPKVEIDLTSTRTILIDGEPLIYCLSEEIVDNPTNEASFLWDIENMSEKLLKRLIAEAYAMGEDVLRQKFENTIWP